MIGRLTDLTRSVGKIDPIQHVILLMLENHSLDQMLGCFSQLYPDLDGIDSQVQRFNLDDKNQKIFQKETTETQMTLDPLHEVPNVLTQISENNSGFVKDFVTNYPKSTDQDRQNVMGYYPYGFLPALHALAAEYTICDHWFSSLPGPTWANRFFALSGTTSGRVKTPSGITDRNFGHEIFYQNQKNIFDCLDEAKVTWRNYYGDFPISLVLTHQREPHNLINYRKMDSFFKDANSDATNFPAFSFIEPKYMGEDQNDDHPPHNTMKAEKLIADVYNAVRSNEKLWQSTLLIVNYDEHGGFYDHVQPPAAIPPDSHTEEYSFTQLGVRVPSLLISPWVKKGVEKTTYDHTSVLKYLSDKWQLSPLGERTKQANSIASALNFEQAPRQDCLPYIHISNKQLIPKNSELEKWDDNANHLAIHSFADFIKNVKNCKTHSQLSASTCKDKAKEKLGHKLVKLGMWLQKDSYAKRENRIAHTCEVAGNITGSAPSEVEPNNKFNRRS